VVITFRRILIFFLIFFACLRSVEASSVHLYLHTKPLTLDPRRTGERRTQLILRELFEGLTRIDKEGKPSLALARSFDISPESLQYTFTLRESYWSNGLPLTAHDFEWTWKSILDPEFASPVAHFLFFIKNGLKAHLGQCSLDQVGVKALDAHTLLITLEHSSSSVFELLSNPVFSPVCSAIAKKDPHWHEKTPSQYISNGPFILKEYDIQSRITLEKNPSYWDINCKRIDTINFSIIEDAATAFALFQKGELDWYGDPCGIIPIECAQQLSPQLVTHSAGGLYLLVCSSQNPLLNPKVRQAIASAINRKQLCRFINGGETPALSLLPNLSSELSFSDNSPLKAKQLLDEGCAEMNITKDQFPPLVISHWAESTSRIIAQLLQAQLRASLGIDVQLAGYDWSSYVKKLYSGDFDLITAAHNPTTQDPLSQIEYIHTFFWKDDQFKILIDKAKRCSSRSTPYIQQAEQLLSKHLPIIPLYSLRFKYAKAKGLQGEALSPIGAIELKEVEWLPSTIAYTKEN